MQIRIFAHSWLSDWNHGNAHFLRGWASALLARGHQVRVYEGIEEAWGGWSLARLWQEPGGAASVRQMRAAFPELDVRLYALNPALGPEAPVAAASGAAWVEDWEAELRTADLVIAHEWNPFELFSHLLAWRRRHGFRLLLHDTHHRALSQPESVRRLPIAQLDGVLAFGESLRRVYERWGARRSYTLHEAADVRHFQPGAPVADDGNDDVVWIGNWGDGERTAELEQYLLRPCRGRCARLYGVRYPPAALRQLAASGIAYGGYLPNLATPAVYARAKLSVHIPRRYYAHHPGQAVSDGLPGIPTIRVFEALACGAALLCAPWRDGERLFTAGEDFLIAADARQMAALYKQLLSDPTQRNRMGQHGRATILARHTCAHRAQELEVICRDLD